MTPLELLERWVSERASEEALHWLSEQRKALAESYSDRKFHIAFGMMPRRLGKSDLALSESELELAETARAGWNPRHWSIAEAARILLLIETDTRANEAFANRFKDLCKTADVAEAITLYRGLALYPEFQQLEPQAGEGLRTNIRTVFEAVAHENPFPREVFDQDRWNHMVLKALFVDSPLAPIDGLDERANPELARIMCDYAHERWAASRPVSPELWRCVGPFAEGAMLDDLARAYGSDNDNEARAAALALLAAGSSAADTVLATRPEIEQAARAGTYTWNDIAHALA
ncbi:MAG: EboA domain-containing protein [Pseudomonadota bacterium]